MGDYIVRATAANDNIRIFAMTSSELVEEARRRHKTSNVVTAALGRLMTAGALMGSMLKNPTDVLTLQIEGSGPVQGLTVTAGIGEQETDGKEHDIVCVKGYPKNPVVEIPLKPSGKLDVGGAIGKGILTVIKDMGLKEPFSGQTELISGEIAEDLTYYFVNSEQVPSSVALGVLVEPGGSVICAGGFIIQLLPFAEDEVITKLEERLGSLEPVTSMLAAGKTPEQIVEEIFGDMDLKIVDHIPARFYCDCSKERVRKAVMSIDAADIKEMIAEDRPIEVNCHFCGSSYTFSVNDLKNILAEKTEK
ncbi:MAG: Hsp33 family molecular chaperone HslO [Lachnospiraceae bacterium]|nr:Hsp33 family molecular chaperone HslO [Lachnospiraceae bacterium]MBO4560029.1 Hsp33 family molecular chaperone HslO [Lachnospiraceae bacterium]MBR5731824.1 Hsp33 family molecular chaperone HslO [Lachnospiraceae bacterium]